MTAAIDSVKVKAEKKLDSIKTKTLSKVDSLKINSAKKMETTAKKIKRNCKKITAIVITNLKMSLKSNCFLGTFFGAIF